MHDKTNTYYMYYEIDLKMAHLLTKKSSLPMVQKLYKS